MKKRIALVLVLALSLISVFALCVSADYCYHENTGYERGNTGHILSCYDCQEALADEEPHSLTYGSISAEGHELYCAVEGCYYSEVLPHEFDSGEYVDEGVEYHCDCGYQYIEHYHDFVYTPNGSMYHTVTCSKCDYSSQATHDIDFDNGTYTEGSGGSLPYWTYYCKDCGYEHVVQYNPSHTCDETKYNAKYVDGDLHEYVCTVCDKQFKTEAHAWNNGVVTKQPTPTENGVRTFTCTICKGTKTETIDYTDLDKLLENMTQAEAIDLYKKIFDKYRAVLIKDSECMEPYLEEFVSVIYPDIAEKGAGSKYFAEYQNYYYAIMSISPSNSSDYTRGYNDAMASVINENPVQGLFQGMWSGIMHFVVVLGNGVSIGGVTLFSVLMTLCMIALVFFVIKLLRK